MTPQSPERKASRFLGFLLAVLAISALILAGTMIGLVPAAMAATPAKHAAAPAQSVTLSLTVFKEQRKAQADGTTTVTLLQATRAVPGDHLVYVLAYANKGAAPASDVVINYPLPEGVTYSAVAEGTPAPLVSADGHSFAATADKTVTALRWTMGSLAPGAQGTISFKAAFN